MGKKITWLHFSDLHVFAQQAGNVAITQAYKKLSETIKPDFIVVTGDFQHLGYNTTFKDGVAQLEKLLEIFEVEKKDVFLIPGNHDVGPVGNPDDRTTLINSIHEKTEADYQYYAQYQGELLSSFSGYREMVKLFYSGVLDDSDPRIQHSDNVYHVCWNNTLNILGINTALISDGKRVHKDIFDVNTLVGLIENSDFHQELPTILLGHHALDALYGSQAVYLRTFLHRTNTSVYLHGDVHKLCIQDSIGSIMVPEKIPSISCGKSAPEAGDSYSDISFLQYEWENCTVAVTPYVYGEIGGILQFKESDVYNTEEGKLSFPMRGPFASLGLSSTPVATNKVLGSVVPVVSAEEFIGRNAVMADLSKLLQRSNPKVWIHAPGGIGKSTVVKRLYHTVSDQFERLIFVNCGTSLEESLADTVPTFFYDPYGLIPADAEKNVRFEKIIEHLQNCGGKSLIILDNVSGDLSSAASIHRITGIPATILVTARTAPVPGYIDFPLESLSDCAQKQLFLRHFGSDHIESSILLKFLECCYCNTLLIELTAKVAKRRGINNLLEALENGGFKKESTPVFNTEGKRSPISDHLRHLYNLVELDDESQRVLRCFALMPSGPIEERVARWLGIEVRLLFDLSDMAWLKNQDGYFEMHPLVRETILLDKDTFPENTVAAFYVYLFENNDEFFDITLGYRILPRRLTIAGHLLLYPVNTLEYAEACNNLAIALSEQCIYDAAEFFLLRSLTTKENLLGARDPRTAAAYHNLAMLYQERNKPGDWDMAEKLHLKNLKIKKRKLDAYHPDTATSYNNLALFYQKRSRRGDWKKAMKLYHKAIKIREKVLGKEHPDTANSYNNLAFLYKSWDRPGDWGKAEVLYRKALAIRENELGREHPEVALTCNNLASLYLVRNRLGDWEQAEKLYLRALAIWKNTLGEGHPSTAMTYNNLASLYKERKYPGDWERAKKFCLKALAIYEKILGKEHPNTASTYCNLADLYMERNQSGDFDMAEKYLLKAKETLETVLGTQHPDTVDVYRHLVILYCKWNRPGDREKALGYYQKSKTTRSFFD